MYISISMYKLIYGDIKIPIYYDDIMYKKIQKAFGERERVCMYWRQLNLRPEKGLAEDV